MARGNTGPGKSYHDPFPTMPPQPFDPLSFLSSLFRAGRIAWHFVKKLLEVLKGEVWSPTDTLILVKSICHQTSDGATNCLFSLSQNLVQRKFEYLQDVLAEISSSWRARGAGGEAEARGEHGGDGAAGGRR